MSLLQDTTGLIMLLSSVVLFAILVLGVVDSCGPRLGTAL